MWFWIFMFFCNLIVPAAMIIGGNFMQKHTVGKISSGCGYRTPRSTLNIDTWNFAQEYSGRLWKKAGGFMLIPSVLIQLPFYGKTADTVGTVQCLVMLASIPLTERALKQNFTEEGIPR